MNDFLNLCKHNADKLSNDPTILYELFDMKWIANIIIDYNKLGFLTFTSQPGKMYSNIMYKSEYCRLKEPTKENILQSVTRKQRAYVRGYMDRSMADFIFSLLQNDPYLFIRTSNNNRPANFVVKFGSVNFIDDQPVLTEEINCNTIEETKNNPDADWSFNFNLLLRRPFSLEYPNTNYSNIVEIEILDIRWDENNYIWIKLLENINLYSLQL